MRPQLVLFLSVISAFKDNVLVLGIMLPNKRTRTSKFRFLESTFFFDVSVDVKYVVTCVDVETTGFSVDDSAFLSGLAMQLPSSSREKPSLQVQE